MPHTLEDGMEGRLIAATLDLLSTGGVRAITARSVAQIATGSASAVNYYFGGRDGLVLAAMTAAVEQAATWRDTCLSFAPVGAPGEALAGWLATIIQDAATDTRYPALALRETQQLAVRLPDACAIARAHQDGEDAFWTEVAQRFALKPSTASALADFFAAAVGIHTRAEDWRADAPWLIESCHRIAARLAGRRDHLPGWDGWREIAEMRADPRPDDHKAQNPTTLRILEAAVAVSGQEGVSGLTHRAVAGQAGVSLAAVSQRYPTKVSLVRATFTHRYESVRGEDDRPEAPPRPTTSPLALGRQVAGGVVDNEGRISSSLVALDELFLAASRDPELRTAAAEIRAARGGGTAVLFRRMEQEGAAPDRMDAYLGSLLITGAMRASYGLEPAGRRDWLMDRMGAALDALFGRP